MFAKLTGGLGRSNPSNNQDTKITPVDYPSNPVEIPSSFLTGPPENPIVTKPIDFASTSLPQYAPHTALILENVLSPAECAQLLTLAEASVPTGSDGDGGAGGKGNASASPWRPAKVSLGPGWEAAAPGYRESDRIVWDQQTVVDRLWERCAAGSDGLRELLAVVPETFGMGPGRWEFRRFNDRMRFLKYSPGQFFKREDFLALTLPHSIRLSTKMMFPLVVVITTDFSLGSQHTPMGRIFTMRAALSFKHTTQSIYI